MHGLLLGWEIVFPLCTKEWTENASLVNVKYNCIFSKISNYNFSHWSIWQFFLRWNWKHGFISSSPDKVEYLIPWSSCFQKYYLASQLCSLQKWWCWRKGQWLRHGAAGAHSSAKSCHRNASSPSSQTSISWVSEIQDKLILFLQQCFLLHLQIKKKSLRPARPLKEGLIFKEKCLYFLNSTTALLRAQIRPRLPDYRKKLFVNKQVLKLSLKAISTVQNPSTKSQMWPLSKENQKNSPPSPLDRMNAQLEKWQLGHFSK